MEATLTGDWQVRHGMLPARLRSNEELTRSVRTVLAVSASVRVYRDDLSVHDAFAAVVDSGGLRAVFFG